MKKSILRQLYDGEIYPSENINEQTLPEYRETKKALADAKERFLKMLSDDSRKIFGEIEELYDELATAYSYAGFAHGFKLAVSLIIESQNDADSHNE